MINIDIITRQLKVNGEIIRALVEPLPDEQARWQPDEETWSMQTVMEHMYNEERADFRLHLKEMFSDPPKPWGGFPEEAYSYHPMESCRQALEKFLADREDSLAWLKGLEAPDWEAVTKVSFEPGQSFTLSAGDVLVSWVAHDYLHIRQMNELLYAWHTEQAKPYSVRYAGEW